MSLPRRKFLQLAAGVAALPFANHVARSQAWPTRPINIVVPLGAGTGTDTLTRVIAQPLGIALRQTIVVENKPGANGAIGAAQVARSAPDGYTLLMSTNSPLSAAPTLNKTIAYDPIRDFAPITRVGSYTRVQLIKWTQMIKDAAIEPE